MKLSHEAEKAMIQRVIEYGSAWAFYSEENKELIARAVVIDILDLLADEVKKHKGKK